MAKAKKLDEKDLAGICQRQIKLAEDHAATDLSKRRSNALEYIQGIMTDMPAEKGRSAIVSRDFSDIVGMILPGLMRVFTASEYMAKAEPVREGDEQWAKQAASGINYTFQKLNDGYTLLYSALWDALVVGNAIVKVWYDETPVYETSFHTGLLDHDLATLTEEPDTEILAQTITQIEVPAPPQPVQNPMMAMGPQMMSVNLNEVKIRRLKSKGKIRVECIPPEDYGKDGATTSTEESRFQFHKSEKMRSELVQMGFDREVIKTLTKATDNRTTEEQSRSIDQDDDDVPVDDSTQLVDLYECYFLADVDGDGEAETVRAYYAGSSGGGEVLDWEVWEDENPFVSIPCSPIPHKWAAESIYDESYDIMRVKTVLGRQALDNLYAQNIPQREVDAESVLNPDELFNPSFGGVIWKKAGSQPIVQTQIPFVAGHAFSAMEYFDQVAQRRTGVSRQTAALDPDALSNQTATANQNEHDASYSQVEMIARNMAEMGWTKVFQRILRLMIKHQDTETKIRMKNEWVPIDPRHWNSDMHISINVGLGTGSRERDGAMLGNVFQTQLLLTDKLAAAGAMEDAIQMIPRLFETAQKMAESSGLQLPESYFPEFTEDRVKALMQKTAQPQPDPKMKIEQAKLEAEQQRDNAKMQNDAKRAQFDFTLAQNKMAWEQRQAEEQFNREMALKELQLAREMDLKERQLVSELALKRELGAISAISNAKATSGVHVGGEPG